jgi:cytosine/adenosine deaminase-related metal-dependent hydrolase
MSTHVANNVAPECTFEGVFMACKPPNSRWDVCCKNGVIASLEEHKPLQSDQESEIRFLSPSLCHPHIHLDKCFLLNHPKYADLQIEKGDFAEAMKLTSRFIYLSSLISMSHRFLYI